MRALQPVTGINFGAKKNLRVIKSYKVFSISGFIFMLPFWLLMMFSPELILKLMMPDQIFSPYNLMNFRLLMSIIPVLPIIFISMTFFPAINKGKPVALLGIARQLVFYIPVMKIFPIFLGTRGIYLGALLIDLIIIIWALIISFKEFKILKSEKELNLQIEF
jgi:Na+-driven multidrug efflux pump